MKNSDEEFSLAVVNALKLISEISERDLSEKSADPLISYLYTPDKKLDEYLRDLEEQIKVANYPQKERPSNFHNQIGQLLEQIAYLCFNKLLGITSIKSFQSPGPQYDYLVTGDTAEWKTICKLLYIDFGRRDFLIEVKATKKRVNDQQFARLCNLLELNLFQTGGLGIFFTLNGATGFPKKNDKVRQRSLRDARLRQVMFSLKAKKSIVVLEKDDIFQLNKPGSLVRILMKKVRDIEDLTGVYVSPEIKEPIEKDLPQHLQIA